MSAPVSSALALANERAERALSAVEVTPFSSIEARPVDWLWRHRIPAGTLTLIEGAPGIGKSTVIFDLAARVSRGQAFPDGSPTLAGDVLVVGPEDAAATVLRPRLDAADADVTRVHLVELRAPDGGAEPLLLPRDVERLREAIERCEAPRLIYLDALNDLLAGSRINDDGEVRAALRPLVRLAEDTGIAIVATRHFGKSGNRHAGMAGLGSVGFGAVARSILQVYSDEETGLLLLAGAKSNLGPTPATLAFSLESTGEDSPPRVEWHGVDERSAHDLQRAYRDDGTASGESGTAGALAEASDWLRDELANGPKPKKDLLSAARAEGIAARTLERAKTEVGAVHSREGFGGPVLWSIGDAAPVTVPPYSPHIRQSRHSQNVASMGEYGENGAEPVLPLAATKPAGEPWSAVI